jgi:hypothetical protein
MGGGHIKIVIMLRRRRISGDNGQKTAEVSGIPKMGEGGQVNDSLGIDLFGRQISGAL